MKRGMKMDFGLFDANDFVSVASNDCGENEKLIALFR